MNYAVLIPVYIGERPAFFKAALRSIQEQTVAPSEILVVEDGPITAEMAETLLLEATHDSRIRRVRLAENQGLGACLHLGVQSCSHDLIARMDADDICRADRIERQIAVMNAGSGLAALGSNISEFRNVPGDMDRCRNVPCTHDEIVKFARRRNPLNHMTVLFRRGAVLAAGSYRPMRGYEDYHLWLRMLKMGFRFQNVEEPLVFARIGNGMMSRRRGLSLARQEWMFQKNILSCGLIERRDFAYNVLTRCTIRLMPGSMLTKIYASLLRRKTRLT